MYCILEHHHKIKFFDCIRCFCVCFNQFFIQNNAEKENDEEEKEKENKAGPVEISISGVPSKPKEKAVQDPARIWITKILKKDEVSEKECQMLIDAFKQSKISGQELSQLLDKHKCGICKTQFNQNIGNKTHTWNIIENPLISDNDSNGRRASISSFTCTCTCGKTATITYEIDTSTVRTVDHPLVTKTINAATNNM